MSFKRVQAPSVHTWSAAVYSIVQTTPPENIGVAICTTVPTPSTGEEILNGLGGVEPFGQPSRPCVCLVGELEIIPPRLLPSFFECFLLLDPPTFEIEELSYMARRARDESTDAVENATSHHPKLVEAQAAQTENQQRAEHSKQDSPIDVAGEGSAKPARRKGNTKATKRTQQAPQTPGPTEKSNVKVSGPSDEVITPVPQTTNAPAIGTARRDFVADPEPIPQGGGFLCTFTLSRPGLVGLNKLAIYLNNLEDSGSIGGWQANGWEDAANKVRALIKFGSHADAIIAIKDVR